MGVVLVLPHGSELGADFQSGSLIRDFDYSSSSCVWESRRFEDAERPINCEAGGFARIRPIRSSAVFVPSSVNSDGRDCLNGHVNRTSNRAISYTEFRHAVRRYRPSDLIPALAEYSAAAYKDGEWELDPTVSPPWAVSAIARDAILHGNEYRSGSVDPGTVRRLVGEFGSTYDAVTGTAAILTPLAHEQFPYQESEFEELSRIYALFEDPTLGPELDWTVVFGMQLREAVRAAFVLRIWVTRNCGRFDPAVMDLPHMQEVFEFVAPREHLETAVRVLSATVAEAKEANALVPDLPRSLQRYTFNPLTARPLVNLADRGIWAPQVMLVDRSLYPSNLYYRGVEAWGNRFAEVLGTRTEAYVGRQLDLIADKGELHGEIVYGRDAMRSVDWIWVTPRAVILVECKSARLTLGARAGDPTLPKITDRYLTQARNQLDRTSGLIRSRTPPFDQFPDDRPIVGLAVTCEPFYLGNSQLAEYGKDSAIPSVVMSLRDLERWVSLPAGEAVDRLLEILNHPERKTWSFGVALGDLPGLRRNPILDAAWKQYDFLENEII
ncbi:hypothetical protein GS571_05800 [Rhodococcus hoagii]|nr:hypothetical protein [Prescottella equi]